MYVITHPIKKKKKDYFQLTAQPNSIWDFYVKVTPNFIWKLQLLDNETSLQTLICNLQEENRMLKQKVAHVSTFILLQINIC